MPNILKFHALLVVLFVLMGAGSAFSADDAEALVQARVEQMRDRNRRARDARVEKAKVTKRFKALTFNLGLLNNFFVKVPAYQERTKAIFGMPGQPGLLERYLASPQSPDFVFFQELWYGRDFASANAIAERSGYVAVAKDYEQDKVGARGQQIYVRRALVAGAKVDAGFTPYLGPDGENLRAGFEGLRAFQIERGMLFTRIELVNGWKLLLANTHLTATVGQNKVRAEQARQLAANLLELERDAHFVVLGSDFNLSPDLEPGPMPNREGWEQNRLPWVEFADQTGLLDSVAAIHVGEPLYSQDRRRNLTTRFSSACKDEPEQRLDFLWVKGATPRYHVEVVAAKLEFTDPLPDVTTRDYAEPDGAKGRPGRVWPSDHFGVWAEYLFFEV